ncbi:hypothetical protein [Pseudoprevotella muciniphila]|uniref:hypothetical protein n=1 Tax=Pseudoprevotella muciniphila TaxID=2133944 RepID=UPI0011BD0A5E|nr:hypothetical protein [Pseudoprevotella muciniphila]
MEFTHSVNMTTNWVTKLPMDYTKWPKVIESLSKSSEENFNNIWGRVINRNLNGSAYIVPETPNLTGLMTLKTGPDLIHVIGHEFTHLTRPYDWLHTLP